MKKFYNKFAIYGAGSWGTALAINLALSHDNIILYANEINVVQEIQYKHTNNKYLPGISIPKNITATNELEEVLLQEVIVIAVPSSSFKEVIKLLKDNSLTKTTVLLIATKGLIDHPVSLFSEFLKKELPNNFAFIYGPNFAQEVANGLYSTATIGCGDLTIARNLATDIATENFIIDTTNDIITLQIAASVKNIVAILSGINEANRLKENAKAALIIDAIKEIKALSSVMGGKEETLITYGVLGDLILTCYSKTSRNMRFGYEFTNAKNKKEFLKNLEYLVEGKESINLLISLAKQYNVKLPLINSIFKLLKEEN